jgi:AraC-like DNA-binding protein
MAGFRDQVLNPPGAWLGTRNAVCGGRHGVGRPHVVSDFPGALSLKVVLDGHAVWTTDVGRHRLEPGCCLILSRGQVYSLATSDDEPAETFCPFFADGFLEDVTRSLGEPETRLLDDPEPPRPAISFPEQIRRVSLALAPSIGRLGAMLAEAEVQPLAWDEAFFDLAAALLRVRPDLYVDLAPANARPAVREEITRRLARAVDYLHAHADRTIALEELAGAAALSPHHFHRLFHAAFGVTPHGYLTRLRMARAARLLARTDQPVTEVCAAVGFESLGSFSTRFRKAFGVPPSAWRAAAS